MSNSEKHYITPMGARNLKAELDQLWRVKRPEVTRNVAAAAALGDRSENADYIYGKKLLREIDSRVRFLRKRIDNLEIVVSKPDNQEKVYFGAWITLEDDEGNISTLRIVGADEIDLKKSWISLNSPVAKSLLGKNKGDYVILERPKGQTESCIIEISYQEIDS